MVLQEKHNVFSTSQEEINKYFLKMFGGIREATHTSKVKLASDYSKQQCL